MDHILRVKECNEHDSGLRSTHSTHSKLFWAGSASVHYSVVSRFVSQTPTIFCLLLHCPKIEDPCEGVFRKFFVNKQKIFLLVVWQNFRDKPKHRSTNSVFSHLQIFGNDRVHSHQFLHGLLSFEHLNVPNVQDITHMFRSILVSSRRWVSCTRFVFHSLSTVFEAFELSQNNCILLAFTPERLLNHGQWLYTQFVESHIMTFNRMLLF